MRVPFRLRVLVALAVTAGCVDDPPSLAITESALSGPIVIGSVVEDGFGSDGRRFLISGTFPTASGCTHPWFWERKHPSCYGVHVDCHGALLLGTITSKSSTQIAVRIPERPSAITGGSQCTFRVKASDQTGAAISDFSLPLTLSSPPIQIHGVQDVPRAAGSNWHYFGLYGFFPTGGNFTSTVVCDGVTRTSSVTTPNNPSTVLDQVNIRFAEYDSTTKSCSFSIRRLNDNAVTPLWNQRVNGSAAGLVTTIGAYHWGGFQPDWLDRTHALPVAVRRLREAGVAGAIRLSITPAQLGPPTSFWDWYDDWRYGPLPDARCNGLTTDRYLPRQVCTTRFQDALSAVGVGGTVILTTMDEASAGPQGGSANYADPSWMTGPGTTNFDAVKAEYYHLTRNLIATQSGSFKTFIISNWEGDNLLYCGHPAEVVTHYRGVAGLEAPTPLPLPCNTGNGLPQFYQARRDALINWLKARKAGIEQAEAEAGPYSWVFVHDAVEFAAYRFIHNGAPALANLDVLHGVIPAVLPDYALYSSWETTDRGGVDQDFTEIAAYLKNLRPSDPILFGIGEFGRRGQAIAPAGLDGWILKEQIRAARRAMNRIIASGASTLGHLVLWQAFPTIDEQQALLSVEGVETNAMRAARAGATANPGLGSTTVVINAVREVSPDFSHPLCPEHLIEDRIGSNRVFELYGSYPSGTYEAGWRCSFRADGDVLDESFSVVTTVGNTGQRNISIPDVPGKDLWCVFYVENTVTDVRSAEFGPVLSRSKGPCNAPT